MKTGPYLWGRAGNCWLCGWGCWRDGGSRGNCPETLGCDLRDTSPRYQSRSPSLWTVSPWGQRGSAWQMRRQRRLFNPDPVWNKHGGTGLFLLEHEEEVGVPLQEAGVELLGGLDGLAHSTWQHQLLDLCSSTEHRFTTRAACCVFPFLWKCFHKPTTVNGSSRKNNRKCLI